MLFIGITSCSTDTQNDSVNDLEKTGSVSLKSGANINYGQMHNDILDVYYTDYDYNPDDVSIMENSVEEYLIENSSPVTFNDVKSSNTELYSYSQMLYEMEGNVR